MLAAGHEPQQGRLAAAVAADEHGVVVLVEGERDAGEQLLAAEGFGDVVEGDDGHGRPVYGTRPVRAARRPSACPCRPCASGREALARAKRKSYGERPAPRPAPPRRRQERRADHDHRLRPGRRHHRLRGSLERGAARLHRSHGGSWTEQDQRAVMGDNSWQWAHHIRTCLRRRAGGEAHHRRRRGPPARALRRAPAGDRRRARGRRRASRAPTAWASRRRRRPRSSVSSCAGPAWAACSAAGCRRTTWRPASPLPTSTSRSAPRLRADRARTAAVEDSAERPARGAQRRPRHGGRAEPPVPAGARGPRAGRPGAGLGRRLTRSWLTRRLVGRVGDRSARSGWPAAGPASPGHMNIWRMLGVPHELAPR